MGWKKQDMPVFWLLGAVVKIRFIRAKDELKFKEKQLKIKNWERQYLIFCWHIHWVSSVYLVGGKADDIFEFLKKNLEW